MDDSSNMEHALSKSERRASEQGSEINDLSSVPLDDSEVNAKSEQEYDPELVEALVNHAYHLPGNSWWADWRQFMLNNHPVFGICFHHPAHPVKRCHRILALIGSICFGLVLTDIFYLSWIYYEEKFDYELVSTGVQVNITGIEIIDNTYNSVDITTGMLVLWFGGSSLHGMFDNLMWIVAAGTLCSPGAIFGKYNRCKSMASYFIIFSVVIIVAVAGLGVVLRASLNSEDETEAPSFDEINLGNIDGAESFEFLIGFAVELLFAFFVYYPLFGTILFSGCLGCGRFPVLGGRPREIMLAEKENLSNDSSDEEV